MQHAPALAAEQRSGLLEVVVGLLSSLLVAGESAGNEDRRWFVRPGRTFFAKVRAWQ